jgi:hypothetical protein
MTQSKLRVSCCLTVYVRNVRDHLRIVAHVSTLLICEAPGLVTKEFIG